MTAAAQERPWLDELIGRQRSLLVELREVEHWRRLVAARLDLAIAAVTDIDELSRQALCAAQAPDALRDLLGIPPQADAQPDASVLIPLRQVLADLDRYAHSLREAAAAVTRTLIERLEPATGPAPVTVLRPSRARSARARSVASRPDPPPRRPDRFSLPAPTTGEEAG